MSDPLVTLGALSALDLADLRGLPPDLRLDDIGSLLPIDVDHVRREEAGDPAVLRECVVVDLPPFERGLRVWMEGDAIVLLEALAPLGADGDPLLAPDLGFPEAYDDAMLGTIWIERAERVYAARGLALRAHPETDRLAAVLLFAPTSLEKYRQTLRPVQHPIRRFTIRKVARTLDGGVR